MPTTILLSKHPLFVILEIGHAHQPKLSQPNLKVCEITHTVTLVQILVRGSGHFEFIFETSSHPSPHQWCFSIIIVVIVLFVLPGCDFIFNFVRSVLLESVRAYLHLFEVMSCLSFMLPWTLDEHFLRLVPVLLGFLLGCEEFLECNIFVFLAHVKPHFFFRVWSSFVSLSFKCIKTLVCAQVFRLPPFVIFMLEFLFFLCF